MRTPAIDPKIIATLPVFLSVGLIALGVVWWQAPQLAMPLVLGVIAGGLVDLDNGLTGRIQNILFTAIAFCATSFGVQVSMGHGAWFIVVMAGMTFGFTLLGAVGLRYRTIAFGTLAVAAYTTLAYHSALVWWLNPGLILLGALLYSSLTLLLHIVFPHRPVQDGMARAFFTLGEYFDAKAVFFNPDEIEWLDEQRLRLATLNARVIDAFNICRRALFYRMRGQHRHPRTLRMLRYYFIVQDIHERISSSHADYYALARQLENTDLIFRIHRLLELQGQACRDVAASLRHHTPWQYGPRLERALTGCQRSLALYVQQKPLAPTHTIARLLDNLAAIDYQLAQLEEGRCNGPCAASCKKENAAEGCISSDSRIAAQEHDGLRHALRTLSSQMGVHSAVFRHAVRLSLVVGIACLLVQKLEIQQGYWMVLTALFVCQPNYSATLSRVNQRIAGTVLGVVAGSVLPYFLPSMGTKLWIIVVSTTLFFFSRNYKYSWSTFFITIQALTSLSLMGMDVYEAMPMRVLDTLWGSMIAWAAVYFIWPDWKYNTLGVVAQKCMENNAVYLHYILGQLQNGRSDDMGYRTARRQAHESAANLNSALSDMSGQREKYGPQLQQGMELLKTTYALMGYISALGAFRQQESARMDEAFSAAFFRLAQQVADLMGHAGQMESSAFAQALEDVQQSLQALKPGTMAPRPHSILWQQLYMVAEQLPRCQHIVQAIAASSGSSQTGAARRR